MVLRYGEEVKITKDVLDFITFPFCEPDFPFSKVIAELGEYTSPEYSERFLKRCCELFDFDDSLYGYYGIELQ